MEYDYIIDLLSFKFINQINPWKFYHKQKTKKQIKNIIINIGEESIDDIISLDIGDISEMSDCSTNSIIHRNTLSSNFSISFGEETFSNSSNMSICSTNSIINRYISDSDMSISN
jgi:hypothetical protein